MPALATLGVELADVAPSAFKFKYFPPGGGTFSSFLTSSRDLPGALAGGACLPLTDVKGDTFGFAVTELPGWSLLKP